MLEQLDAAQDAAAIENPKKDKDGIKRTVVGIPKSSKAVAETSMFV